MQQQHGREKLAIVLLSVDPGYFGESDEYVAMANKFFESKKIDWPSVFMSGGWNDAVRTFNVSGYGNIVVDAKGIVQGVNVHGKELEKLVEEMVEDKNTNKLLH